jgi:hypothetical protein
MKKNSPIPIPATATTPTTTPAAMPATLVLDPPSDLALGEASGASVCCWLDGIVTTIVVPGAMLVDTAALSAGAEVIDDDDEAVVLDAAVLELALELLESSS